MIPDTTLPSNPEILISLREATVQDVIDFTDMDEGHEEQITTLFLKRMQPNRETRSDAKKWTAEDRRTILFWYWIHTAKDTSISLSYECGHCGKKHSFTQDMRVLGEGYQTLAGRAEQVLRNGMIVRPLSGADMEYLERGRLSLSLTADESGEDSGAYKKKDAQVRLLRLFLHLHNKTELPDPQTRANAIEKQILTMAITEFGELVDEIHENLSDMRHGLDTTMDDYGRIFLYSSYHACPKVEGKEATTRLRVPFRNIEYIPSL